MTFFLRNPRSEWNFKACFLLCTWMGIWELRGKGHFSMHLWPEIALKSLKHYFTNLQQECSVHFSGRKFEADERYCHP